MKQDCEAAALSEDGGLQEHRLEQEGQENTSEGDQGS